MTQHPCLDHWRNPVGKHHRRSSVTIGNNRLENPGTENSSGFAALQLLVHHEHPETACTYFSSFSKLDKCTKTV